MRLSSRIPESTVVVQDEYRLGGLEIYAPDFEVNLYHETSMKFTLRPGQRFDVLGTAD